MTDWTFIDILDINDIPYTFGIHHDGTLGIFSKSCDTLTLEICLNMNNIVSRRNVKKDDMVVIGKLKGTYTKGIHGATGAEYIPTLTSPYERFQEPIQVILDSSPYFGPSWPYNTMIVRFFVIMVMRILNADNHR